MSVLRMLIVGLDGASYPIVEEGARTGRLPFFARIRREGRLGLLRSVVPTLSPPAWSSFLTGLHPGRHGILHFLKSEPRDSAAATSLVTSKPIRGRTFLDSLARGGFRVGSVCVPATYPPWDVGGVMVSGYPCPEGRWCTWPPGIPLTTPLGPHVVTVAGTDGDGPLEEAVAALWRRRDLVGEIVADYELDTLVVVYSAIDHVQHLYGWEASRDRIWAVYREADALLASLEPLANPEALLMVVSDHGGNPPPGWVFRTKRWLIENGLAEADRVPVPADLGTSGEGPPAWVLADPRFQRTLADGAGQAAHRAAGVPVHLDAGGLDPARSSVLRFRLCDRSEGLVVNLRGRQREGVVCSGDYNRVRDGVMEAASRLLRDPGRPPVLEDVRTREDLFPGLPSETALPDVVLLFAEGVRAVGGTEGPILERVEARTPSARGVHSVEGIWGLVGPGVRPGAGFSASILDVAPTVSAYFGASFSPESDGRVRADILSPC